MKTSEFIRTFILCALLVNATFAKSQEKPDYSKWLDRLLGNGTAGDCCIKDKKLTFLFRAAECYNENDLESSFYYLKLVETPISFNSLKEIDCENLRLVILGLCSIEMSNWQELIFTLDAARKREPALYKFLINYANSHPNTAKDKDLIKKSELIDLGIKI